MASSISRVQHNIAAMNALRNYKNNNSALSKNLEKLSSGFKINRAGDDAAGLAISEKMRAQITGISVAQKNANDGISLVQTAEGALTEVHDMLNRMTELATQSANGTYQNDVDREQLQKEIDQLRTEVNRIADSANFNGIKLLNGDLGATATESLSIDPAEAVDFTDGITVEDAAGVGAKSTFELNIDTPFSAGDKITLNFTVPQEGGGSVSQSITLTHTSAAISSTGYANNTDLTFTGVTAEEQINSIMQRLQNSTATSTTVTTAADWNLNVNSTVSASGADAALNLSQIFGEAALANGNVEKDTRFKVTADGTKLTFTALSEAKANTLHFSNAVIDNKDATATIAIATPASDTGKNNTNGVAAVDTLTGLLSGDYDYQAGDKLQFTFLMADGSTSATATVELTNEMLLGDSAATITSRIVNALKETNFDDVASTKGVDESKYKVSDFITVTENAGGTIGTVKFETASGTMQLNADSFKLSGVKLSKQGGSFADIASANTTLTRTAGTAGTDGVAQKKTITFANNLTDGDKFVMNGTLVDGREFKVEATATNGSANAALNEFQIGASVHDTADNIAALLNGGAAKVQVKDGDEWVSVDANQVFGAGKGLDAAITAPSGTDTITITNGKAAAAGIKGITGDVSYVNIETGAASVTGAQTVAGIDQDNAKITLTIDKENMEYGTAVTIGSGAAAKTFELVNSADAAVTTNGNIRVVVEDLERASQSQLVDAFRDAINNELISNYDAETNDVSKPASNSTDGVYTTWANSLGVAKGGADKRQMSNAGVATNIWTGTVNDVTGGTAASDADLASASRSATDLANRGALAEVKDNTITLYTRNFGSNVENIGAKNPGGLSNGITLNYVNDDSGNIKLKAGDTIDINGKTYQFDTSTRNLQGNNALIKVSADAFANQDKAAIASAIKLAVEEEDSTITARINQDNSVTLGAANVNGVYKTPTASQTLSGGGLTLQIGDTSESFNKLTVEIKDMHTKTLGLENISVLDQSSAADAIDTIKNAINMVSDVRGTLGATQNRLEHTISNLGTMQENLQAAESAIRDTDVAEEMMTYTKNSILNQAAQAMLAQANQLPQGVLQLLQ